VAIPTTAQSLLFLRQLTSSPNRSALLKQGKLRERERDSACGTTQSLHVASIYRKSAFFSLFSPVLMHDANGPARTKGYICPSRDFVILISYRSAMILFAWKEKASVLLLEQSANRHSSSRILLWFFINSWLLTFSRASFGSY
jgi:hypothetical protein